MTTLFLFLIYLKIVQSRVVVAPTDRVVVAGQRMEMECRTNSGTKVSEWTLQRPSTSEKLKVFSNFDKEPNRIDPNFKHFGADVDANGSGLIYSNETRLEDAGVYTCRVQEGQKQPVPHSAQLIVLEKEPVCEKNLTSDISLMGSDKIWFQCSFNFSGNWAPTSEWRQHCGDMTKGGHVLTEGVETITATNSSVTSTLILSIESSRSSCNISCKICFVWNNSNTINTTAINTTDYGCLWTAYESHISTGYQLSTWASNPMNDEKGDTTVVTAAQLEPASQLMTVLIVVLTVVSLVALICSSCCICCVCYKRKVTELLIQTAAYLQGGTMESNREKRLSRSKIPVPRPPHAYTPMQISSTQRPIFQESPKVQHRFKEEPQTIEATTGGVNNETYSIALEDEPTSSYATLSRGVQPPNGNNFFSQKCSSIYDRKAESTYATITDSIYMKNPDDTCANSISAKATDGACVDRTVTKATDGDCAESVGSACSSIYDKTKDVDSVESTYDTTTDNRYSAIADSVYDENTDIMYDVVRDT